MDRLIGIDYGKRRTGISVSDPLRIFASALDTVDTPKLIDFLKNYAKEETMSFRGSPSPLKTSDSPPFWPIES